MPVDERGETQLADTGSASGTGSADRQVLGARYELLGLLGSGGMGNVYKARDLELDEVVALKVLRPDIVASPGAVDRFRREVKLARRVTHPNVARVFDIGEHGGDRILTMELVDGESLAALLRRDGGLPVSRAVAIARAVAAGVAAAHAAGVVHRDLKPDNVLLAKDGRVVVTDFGIARAAAEGSRTVGIVGTPAYMAPEQIDERLKVDERADVYAFGAMVYEMLVGQAAWQAESMWALAAARLLQPPPDPRDLRPDLPSALAQLVVGCMARDAAARPQTMAAVDATLAAVVVSEPSKAPARLAPEDRAPPAQTTGTDKRVAVLPFANLGPADQEYVADGLTEDLIDGLSVARGLRVRSRGAVMAFKGSARDARDVGRELDVDVIVEGSVRRGPAGYRVTARVVSVGDGFQLWARRFDVPENELLVENDAIAHAVAEALTAEISLPRRAVVADGRAVDLYLRAKQAFHRMFTDRTGVAQRLFAELLALTPDDPRALAGAAAAAAHHEWWTPAERKAAYDAADRAVALAPMLADGHYARGSIRAFDYDYLGAIPSLRRALELAPQHADAHEVLGRILGDLDDDACVEHLELARRLAPENEFPYIASSMFYCLRGDDARVLEILDASERLQTGLRPMLEPRLVVWNRDVEGAKRVLAKLDMANPLNQVAAAWLTALIDGAVPPAPPQLPTPGMVRPRYLEVFFTQLPLEIMLAAGAIPPALELLRVLDRLGLVAVGWLERAKLLASVRDLPEVVEIRGRAKERAAAILAAYRAAGVGPT